MTSPRRTTIASTSPAATIPVAARLGTLAVTLLASGSVLIMSLRSAAADDPGATLLRPVATISSETPVNSRTAPASSNLRIANAKSVLAAPVTLFAFDADGKAAADQPSLQEAAAAAIALARANPGRLIALDIVQLPLDYSTLPLEQQQKLRGAFGDDAAAKYDALMAGRLVQTIDAVKQAVPGTAVAVKGLPFEGNAQGSASAKNERFAAAIAKVDAFMPKRSLVVLDATGSEAVTVANRLSESIALANGKPILYRANGDWHIALHEPAAATLPSAPPANAVASADGGAFGFGDVFGSSRDGDIALASALSVGGSDAGSSSASLAAASEGPGTSGNAGLITTASPSRSVETSTTSPSAPTPSGSSQPDAASDASLKVPATWDPTVEIASDSPTSGIAVAESWPGSGPTGGSGGGSSTPTTGTKSARSNAGSNGTKSGTTGGSNGAGARSAASDSIPGPGVVSGGRAGSIAGAGSGALVGGGGATGGSGGAVSGGSGVVTTPGGYQIVGTGGVGGWSSADPVATPSGSGSPLADGPPDMPSDEPVPPSDGEDEVSSDQPPANTTPAPILVPGTGFTGPTPQPDAIGSSTNPAFDAKAVARWDVVPNQTIAKDLTVGVVAFHMAGIDRVDFSLNGGPWESVLSMQMNPDSGVVEYSATIPTASMPDGPFEVRAIAYPLAGEPRVLEPLLLYANHGETLPAATLYVSTSGSDSSGNGTKASPFATIKKALDTVWANLAQFDGGEICVLTAGAYDIDEPIAPVLNSRWITIRGDAALSQDSVVLSAGNNTDILRPKTNYLRFENLSLDFSKMLQMYKEDNQSQWYDNCHWFYSAGWTYVPPMGLAPVRNDGYHGLYVTNSRSTDSVYAFVNCNLVRASSAEKISGDVFQNSLAVFSCTAKQIDGNATEHHTDVFQYFGQFENILVYDVVSLDTIAVQNFFLDHYNSSFTDCAFVNIAFENFGGEPPFSQLNSAHDHVLFFHVSNPGQRFICRTDMPGASKFTAHNVIFRNCVLERVQDDDYFAPIPDGVLLDHCHFNYADPQGVSPTTGPITVTPTTGFGFQYTGPAAPMIQSSGVLIPNLSETSSPNRGAWEGTAAAE